MESFFNSFKILMASKSACRTPDSELRSYCFLFQSQIIQQKYQETGCWPMQKVNGFGLRWNPFWLWHWDTCKYQDVGLSWEQEHLPVSINKAGIDVIRSFHASDRLQAYSCGFIWHNINKAVFEFITWKIGTDEPWGVSFWAG